VLALAALSLLPFDRARQGLVMLPIALIFTALWRANLALFWLSSAESVQAFVYGRGCPEYLVPVRDGRISGQLCLLMLYARACRLIVEPAVAPTRLPRRCARWGIARVPSQAHAFTC
jgi:hypothetical protein